MSLQGELSNTAMRVAWATPAAEPKWHQILLILRNPDVLLPSLLSIIGLLAALWLTLLLPFPSDIAAFLAQAS
jgi:hypothetical protein